MVEVVSGLPRGKKEGEPQLQSSPRGGKQKEKKRADLLHVSLSVKGEKSPAV